MGNTHTEGTTMPMPQPMPTQAAPMGAAPGAPGEAETDDGGYTILIKVDGNGSLSVGVEDERGEAPESAEGPEGPEGSAQDPAENEDAEMSPMQPAANIKEALTIALTIFKADGKVSDDQNADAEFDSGYQARGGSSPT